MDIKKLIEEKKLEIKESLPSEKQQQEWFDAIYKDRIFDDESDVISRFHAFQNGMEVLRLQDITSENKSTNLFMLKAKINRLQQKEKDDVTKFNNLVEEKAAATISAIQLKADKIIKEVENRQLRDQNGNFKLIHRLTQNNRFHLFLITACIFIIIGLITYIFFQ